MVCTNISFPISCFSIVLQSVLNVKHCRASKVATPSAGAEWYASEDFVWGCCLFYAACCACRLARFNLSNV